MAKGRNVEEVREPEQDIDTEFWPAEGPLPRVRVVSVSFDMDDPDQELSISYDGRAVSRLEAFAMLDRAREMQGKAAYGPQWNESA